MRLKRKSPSSRISLLVLLMMVPIFFSGCGSLPPTPEIVQFGAKNQKVAKPGFYGVNNKTGEREFRSFDDPRMDGAQCLDSGDYTEMEKWIAEVEELAKRKCK